jgi:6-pyruvoyltetrahydropterin/6-carboxytetrahydropterin synthase
MFEVKIVRHFAAAHRVEDYPGNCERLHGHNWRVEVVARRKELDGLGMVMDFRKLKELTQQALEPFDHNYLNEIPPFDRLNPTAENIARHLYEVLSAAAPVTRVDVYETDTSVASYFKDEDA